VTGVSGFALAAVLVEVFGFALLPPLLHAAADNAAASAVVRARKRDVRMRMMIHS